MSPDGSPRIHYVANVRLPSERANAYQILHQCDALRHLGASVVILAPRRLNRFALPDDRVKEWYGLRREPGIERLPSLDLIDRVPTALQRVPFLLQSATFALSVRRRLKRDRARIVFSRDPWTVALLAGREEPPCALFYEVHDLPERPARRARLVAALSRSAGAVAISRGLADDLRAHGLPGELVCVLPDGYDPARFRDMPDRGEARERLALPRGRPLAVYTGHLFPWKGAHVLVEAAASARSFDAVLVGGRGEDRDRLRRRVRELGADNVHLIEPVPPRVVPDYLAAADVLVLPNSGREVISARYTSPLKLFEYMAAGRPIVASDLPSLREILQHGETALLARPDDPDALAAAIGRVLDDPALARSLAAAARERAGEFTWDARARRLLDFIESRLQARV